MHVFLDIGFTLLGGPELSPPKRIAQILGVGNKFVNEIREIVFCEEHRSVQSVVCSLQKRLGQEVDPYQHEVISEVWNAQYEEAYLLDGAGILLDYLAKEPLFQVHVVSNLWYPFYRKFRDTMETLPLRIQTETLSFVEGVMKPSLEFYQRAFTKAGSLPMDSIMIGDSLDNDMEPCSALGLACCIWFNSRPAYDHSRQDILLPEGVRETGDFSAVVDILETYKRTFLQ